MKAIILTAAILMTTCLSAQETLTIYVVESQIQPPMNEWYILDGEQEDNIFYMDFETKADAETQIDLSLEEMDADFDSGTLVDMGDGIFYIEWNGVWHDADGNDVNAYFVYMFSENNADFHRIAVQYSM